MTEPENFEEDLFADLYDDNEVSKAALRPEAISQPTTFQAPEDDPVLNITKQPSRFTEEEQVNLTEAQEDDDDDVDFNLGGGNNGIAPVMQKPDAPSPPALGSIHKASAKEDG